MDRLIDRLADDWVSGYGNRLVDRLIFVGGWRTLALDVLVDEWVYVDG